MLGRHVNTRVFVLRQCRKQLAGELRFYDLCNFTWIHGSSEYKEGSFRTPTLEPITPMAIQLIVSDVDGCMTPEASVAWDFDHFAQLCRLVQQASTGQGPLPPLTLCTGRPQPYVEALMKLMNIRLPAICEAGAIIYDLSSNHARYTDGVTPAKLAGLRAVRCFVEEQILPRFPGTLIQFGKEAQLSIYCEKPDIFPTIRQLLESFITQRGGPELDISASHFYLNIGLAGVDKGLAIRDILKLTGIDKAHAAGIGDTEGDLAIRREVAWFACPANATGPIKAVADYVSPSPMLEGMLDILKRLSTSA